MRLYPHKEHWYTDAARRTDYRFMPDMWREVPEDVAIYMVDAHPDKFCILEEDEAAGKHRCPKSEGALAYATEEMEEPPVDRMATASHKK